VASPAHLIDSNILLRIARRGNPDHVIVDAALARLAGDGAILYYTLQNIAEFWNVRADADGRRSPGTGDRKRHDPTAGPRGHLP
jgi:hypothetical protein